MTETKLSLLVLSCLLLAGSCDTGRQESVPTPPPPTPIPKPEPLETVTMEEAEILPIEEPKGENPSAAGFPCSWASIWGKPGGMKPLPVGGMIKSPKKLRDVPPAFPRRETETRGTPVLEVVIDTSGNVAEATILQSVIPPWPEGDAALLSAIQQWKYEPSELDGNPIALCMKITLAIEWN